MIASLRPERWLFTSLRLAVTLGAMAAAYAGSPAASSAEAPFLAENQAAMDKMMASMEIKLSGDVDHELSAMMIPHHQGAIDMAQPYDRTGLRPSRGCDDVKGDVVPTTAPGRG
jgi:hypothetical protein